MINGIASLEPLLKERVHDAPVTTRAKAKRDGGEGARGASTLLQSAEAGTGSTMRDAGPTP